MINKNYIKSIPLFDYFVYAIGLKIGVIPVFGDTGLQTFDQMVAYVADQLGKKEEEFDCVNAWRVSSPIKAVEFAIPYLGSYRSTPGKMLIGAKYEGPEGTVTWLGEDKIESFSRDKVTHQSRGISADKHEGPT
jgi:hypothetical protein